MDLDDLLDNALGPDPTKPNKQVKIQSKNVIQAAVSDDLDDWGFGNDDVKPPAKQIQIQPKVVSKPKMTSDWDLPERNDDDMDWDDDDNQQKKVIRADTKTKIQNQDEFEDILSVTANFNKNNQDMWQYELPVNQQQKTKAQRMRPQEVVVETEQPGECYPLFIAGSAYMSGRTQSSMKPMVCSKLRCTNCDKKVVRFEHDVKWKESVDYIFVRNHNTNPDKLREGTEPAPGYSAYAC